MAFRVLEYPTEPDCSEVDFCPCCGQCVVTEDGDWVNPATSPYCDADCQERHQKALADQDDWDTEQDWDEDPYNGGGYLDESGIFDNYDWNED